MPLLRFQTGDICVAHRGECSCGRGALRLGPIIGRKDQLIKYKGTSLFPATIYSILQGIPSVRNFQVEVSSGELNTDEVLINIGLEEGQNLTFTEISDIFKAKLRVVPKVNFLPVQEIEKRLFSSEGRKPQVFVDKRVFS
jgi:phenylacetate-CoA ligase